MNDGCVLDFNPILPIDGSIAAVTRSSAPDDNDSSSTTTTESCPHDDNSSSPPIDQFDNDVELLDHLFDMSTNEEAESPIQQPAGYTETTAENFEDLSKYLMPNRPSFRFQKHEAKLLHIIKDNNLPPALFDAIMSWALEAFEAGYKFKSKKYN